MTIGEQYRVKHTAVLRKYGVRVGGPFVDKGDEVAWPGDVGTVTDSSYVHQPSGERVTYITLEFSRGRRLVLDVTEDGRIVWPGLGAHVADFVRVAAVDA